MALLSVHSTGIQNNKKPLLYSNNKERRSSLYNYSNPQISTVNLNKHPAAIAFKGYSPEPELKNIIRRFVTLVKADTIKNIAILTHSGPDCDAIGSMIATREIIKEGTGKTPDMFTMKPLLKNMASLDPKKEIKVITNLISNTEDLKTTMKAFLDDYDLVIVTDTPLIKLLDEELGDTILKNAKKIVKIDHHPKGAKVKPEDYNFANLNIIDTKKESASQIVMQLVKPFGLDPKKINPKISKALASGIVTDSGQFQFSRGKSIYKDAAELQNSTDVGKIIREVNSLDLQEFSLFVKILNKVKFSDDKEIAYFIIKRNQVEETTKNVNIAALNQLSKIFGVKYCFSVQESTGKVGKVNVSLRSNDKPINYLASEYGGGGHALSSGLSVRVKNTEDFAIELLDKITKLKNS